MATDVMRHAVLSRDIFRDVAPGTPDAPLCVVMDWNLGDDAVATLVAFHDGTTSLYLSSGGGVIGGGAHERVRLAASRFRDMAARAHRAFNVTTDFAVPPNDHSRFFLVTARETLATTPIPNDALQQQQSELAPLANAAQAVIAELRRVS